MEGQFDGSEGVSNTMSTPTKPTHLGITFDAREISDPFSQAEALRPSEYETDPQMVLLRIEILLQRIVDFCDRIAIPSWLIKK
jgi:hypothetical protein